MKKEHILIFIFAASILCSCNSESKSPEPLTPEQEKTIEEFGEAVKKNQLEADSIARLYNKDYSYTIPITAHLDKGSPLNDVEICFFDVPYYGMCNRDTTNGFIFSLHSPEDIISVKISRSKDEYSAYGNRHEYWIRFK